MPFLGLGAGVGGLVAKRKKILGQRGSFDVRQVIADFAEQQKQIPGLTPPPDLPQEVGGAMDSPTSTLDGGISPPRNSLDVASLVAPPTRRTPLTGVQRSKVVLGEAGRRTKLTGTRRSKKGKV
jgi:hypothetical protein